MQPGQAEFSDLIASFEARGIGVVFYGGYQAEAGLIVRQAKARLPGLAFVVPDGVGSEDFALIAGAAAEGIPMTYYMDAARQPAAAAVVAEFRAAGTDPIGSELSAYAAVQAWAQAVEQAGTTEAAAVAQACAGRSSIPCSAPSASTPRATSPASIPSPGTSGPRASGCPRT